MNNLLSKFKNNLVFVVEVLIYGVLLGLNVFFALVIYNRVIETVAPSSIVPEIEVAELNSLDEELLTIFREDHFDRKLFKRGVDEVYEDRWGALEKSESPF